MTGFGYWVKYDTYSVGGWISGYGVLVYILVPVKDTVLVFGDTPCTINIRVVVSGFIGPLLWIYQSDGGL